jgi:hypothetical protein
LAVQDILSCGGGIGGHAFEKQEREIPEFAAELLAEFRKSLKSNRGWRRPDGL